MKTTILILSLFTSMMCLAQDDMDTSKWTMQIYGKDTFWVAKPNAGDLARDEGDAIGAIEAFQKLYAEDPDNRTIAYNMSCMFALTWQVDSAFHYLNIASITDSSVHPLADPDYYHLLSDPRWEQFENEQIERVQTKHGAYANLPLTKELLRMSLKDQAFYYQVKIAREKLGRQSPVYLAIWELKNELNAQNLERIEEIVEEHGWPKKSEVGGRAAGAAFLIVQHSDLEVQKKYLPIMTAAADAGEARWSSLALLIDRINLRDGKEQIYGSQISMDEDGKYFVEDLFEPEYVNQRREEVGLGPIQEYVNRWDVEWTIEQKENRILRAHYHSS